jgi:hypothetical protein
VELVSNRAIAIMRANAHRIASKEIRLLFAVSQVTAGKPLFFDKYSSFKQPCLAKKK